MTVVFLVVILPDSSSGFAYLATLAHLQPVLFVPLYFQRKNGASSVNRMNGVMFPGNSSLYSDRWDQLTCQ